MMCDRAGKLELSGNFAPPITPRHHAAPIPQSPKRRKGAFVPNSLDARYEVARSFSEHFKDRLQRF
jgi:hypothetical protein